MLIPNVFCLRWQMGFERHHCFGRPLGFRPLPALLPPRMVFQMLGQVDQGHCEEDAKEEGGHGNRNALD
jgi:hypothetical protein